MHSSSRNKVKMRERLKNYFYSAVSSTFLFVVLRETGMIGKRNLTSVDHKMMLGRPSVQVMTSTTFAIGSPPLPNEATTIRATATSALRGSSESISLTDTQPSRTYGPFSSDQVGIGGLQPHSPRDGTIDSSNYKPSGLSGASNFNDKPVSGGESSHYEATPSSNVDQFMDPILSAAAATVKKSPHHVATSTTPSSSASNTITGEASDNLHPEGVSPLTATTEINHSHHDSHHLDSSKLGGSDSAKAAAAVSDAVSSGRSSSFTSQPPAAAASASLRTASTGTSERPIMHTFYELIPSHQKGTQMSDGADRLLLQEWTSAWEAAGWNTRILTLSDAKKHQDFAKYSPQLNNVPMWGVDGLGGNIVYNQLCFLRWLAMAAVGGGFMSDYDVFPLSKVPEWASPQGDFTVYSVVKGSITAGIPCLMSGRPDEWTRMAHAILQNGLQRAQNKTITMWSDMLALIDMRKDRAYNVHDSVVEGQDVLLPHPFRPEDCPITGGKMAVHFSHEALRNGYIEPGETAEHRAKIVHRFLAQYHPVCTPGDFSSR